VWLRHLRRGAGGGIAGTYAGDDFDVKVRLSRQPTGEEQQQLYDVINAGLDEYRGRIAAAPG